MSTTPNIPKQGGIAARAGRWSAAHRKKAILGWLAFVILALFAGSAVGLNEPGPGADFDGESRKAEQVLADAGYRTPAGEMVLVQSKTKTATDPAFRDTVADVKRTVSRQAVVENVTGPQVSKDGRSALVQFDLRGAEEDALDKIEPVMATVDEVAARHEGVSVRQFGSASAEFEVEEAIGKDFKRAETLSLPLTAVILFVAFGALVAAGIPLLLGLTAVAGSFGLVNLISQLFALENNASLILLIGLAVGVDYSLFYLRREREERAKGASKDVALETAAATSGRAVLVSGMTVIIAMAGMFITGNTTFIGHGHRDDRRGRRRRPRLADRAARRRSSALGDKVERGRIPFLGRRRKAAASRGSGARSSIASCAARSWRSCWPAACWSP